MRRLALALAVLTIASSSVQAQQISYRNGQSVCCFGASSTLTYGQTFTALGNSLNDFSFWVGDARLFGSGTADAFVYAWDATNRRATGGALFSGSLTYSAANAVTMYTVNTTGTSLTTGQVYVAFWTGTSQFANSLGWEGGYGNTYGGGEFVYTNNDYTSAQWSDVGSDFDVSFEANFATTTVPEPMSFVLVGTGLLGVAFARRRRSNA